DPAATQPFLDRMMAAADDRFGIRTDHRAATGDANQILDHRLESGIQDIVLLVDDLRVVTGYNEYARHALQGLFQRGTLRQFRDRCLHLGPEDLARLVRVAHNTDRISAESNKLLDHRSSGIAGCADNSNHRSTPA